MRQLHAPCLAALLFAVASAASAQEPLAPLDTPEGQSGPDADVEAAALFGGPVADAEPDAEPAVTATGASQTEASGATESESDADAAAAPAATDAVTSPDEAAATDAATQRPLKAEDAGVPVDLATGRAAPLLANDVAPAAEAAPATDAAETVDLDAAARMGLTETTRPFDSAFEPKATEPAPAVPQAAAKVPADPDADLIPDEDVPAKTGEDAEIERIAEEYLRASRDLVPEAPASPARRKQAAGEPATTAPKRL
jgi:hypothetical protein